MSQGNCYGVGICYMYIYVLAIADQTAEPN